jgi:hypothetical protein
MFMMIAPVIIAPSAIIARPVKIDEPGIIVTVIVVTSIGRVTRVITIITVRGIRTPREAADKQGAH